MTIHKSQGATCDAVFAVGPSGLYREAAYVALSRARQGATLYATSRQVAEIEERDHTRGLPLPGEAERPEHDLLTAIARSEAKTFATSDDPAAARISDLAQSDLTTLRGRLRTAVAAEGHAKTIGLTDPAAGLAALERARHARTLLAIDRRVRALDRDNVGTITDIHDHDGSATVLFISEDGTTALRTLGWCELKPIDHPDLVPVTLEAQDWLDREAARIAYAAQQWTSALANWSIQPGEAADLRRAIGTRMETLAKQLHADEPEWLTWWIGPRPADPTGATVWDDTIAHLAEWRDLHNITPDVPGLGAQPDDAHSQSEWVDAMTTILSQRTWLATRDPHPDPISVTTLSPVEIHDRIGELERFFADAPPDQGRIIDDLMAGRLTPQDVHTQPSPGPPRPRPNATAGSSPTGPTSSNTTNCSDWPNSTTHWPIGPPLSGRQSGRRPQQARHLAGPRLAGGGPDARRAPRSDRRPRPWGATRSSSPRSSSLVNDRLNDAQPERSVEANLERAALLAAEWFSQACEPANTMPGR